MLNQVLNHAFELTRRYYSMTIKNECGMRILYRVTNPRANMNKLRIES